LVELESRIEGGNRSVIDKDGGKMQDEPREEAQSQRKEGSPVIVFLALPESSHDQFTGSMWLADAAGNASSPWVGALLIAPALIASALGAYLGYSMTTQVESMVERFVAMSGLACAIGGPVIALIIGGFILPWYAVTVGLVIILSGFVISYWLLKRAAREADDVSISLDRGAETTL
jgi:hypothetical protein